MEYLTQNHVETAHEQLWNNCLSMFRKLLSEDNYNTWFRPVVPVSLKGSLLTVLLPNHYFYEWIEEHFVDQLREVITQELGIHGKLEYQVKQEIQMGTVFAPTLPLPGNPVAPRRDSKPEEKKELVVFEGFTLNPYYTFDNFIEGKHNQLARSAGLAVSDRPGTSSYNPLMLYGGVGLGKTHLVQAIGNKVLEQFPNKKVHYISADAFTDQFVRSVRTHGMQELALFYFNLDVLILDDIQFLAGRDKTLDIFFNIFNHFQQNQKQIIMTSDCRPSELKGMHERIRSRLKSGLVTDMQMPDFETRIAIICKKMENDGVHLPLDVVEYMARAVDTNVRELEGAIVSLKARAMLTNTQIDLSLAKSILQGIVTDMERELNVEYIMEAVSEYLAVPVDLLRAATRKRNIVVARQIAMYFARMYTTSNLKSIGASFGGRDHSTVIHSTEAVENIIKTDKRLASCVEELRRRFGKRSQ